MTNQMTTTDNLEMQIASVVDQCSLLNQPAGTFGQLFQMAAGIQQLEAIFTNDVMKSVMAMQGRSLGFLTDKDSGNGYSMPIVRDCLITALLNGARPTGNEFNIIAGKAYLTKEFFVRILRELEGLNDLTISLGVPELKSGIAMVEASATWTYMGRPDSIQFLAEPGRDNRIVVKLNAGMMHDAALGKAERKLRKRIFERITGTTWSGVDEDAGDPADDRKVIEVQNQSGTDTQLIESFKNRIHEAETIEELEAIKAESDEAKNQGMLTLSDYKLHLKDLLNERYRVINKMEPA